MAGRDVSSAIRIKGKAGDGSAWGQIPELLVELAGNVYADDKVDRLNVLDRYRAAEDWRCLEAEYLVGARGHALALGAEGQSRQEVPVLPFSGTEVCGQRVRGLPRAREHGFERVEPPVTILCAEENISERRGEDGLFVADIDPVP
jgi:hypothetical protein